MSLSRIMFSFWALPNNPENYFGEPAEYNPRKSLDLNPD